MKYSSFGANMLLIGTGDSCLQPLSWILRMKISLVAANVLAFLHNGEETVIHRDITSSNILLDSVSEAF